MYPQNHHQSTRTTGESGVRDALDLSIHVLDLASKEHPDLLAAAIRELWLDERYS
jgi:hypothetical protein